MIYQSQKMRLQCVRIVSKSEINDILICQDLNMADDSLYTLLVVKDHDTVKKYLQIFENTHNSLHDSFVDSFSDGSSFCMVFPYKRERALKQFYMGESYSLSECEDVCINLILACITAGIPYPILYLMLEQDQLHLSKDHSVYFSYQIRLDELDDQITERDCVVACARILTELLKPKETQKAISYILLRKKIAKRNYHKFTELYKDIRIAAVSKNKQGIIARIRNAFSRNKDLLFRIFLRICIVLAVIVVVSFVCQIFFGEVTWLRLFINGFKKIGTESLIQ